MTKLSRRGFVAATAAAALAAPQAADPSASAPAPTTSAPADAPAAPKPTTAQEPGGRDTKKSKLKQKPTDDDYDLSRFKPLLKTMLEVSLPSCRMTIISHTLSPLTRKTSRTN